MESVTRKTLAADKTDWFGRGRRPTKDEKAKADKAKDDNAKADKAEIRQGQR